jgi:hypothetical protein
MHSARWHNLYRCIQHPYLLSPDIEPKDLSPQEAHERLISTSSKLRLLRNLLPKLKARSHRILLFSQVCPSRSIPCANVLMFDQFVIVLDIVEDFLVGEGFKFLRLVRISKSYSTLLICMPRMEVQSKLIDRKEWTNSIIQALMSLSISWRLAPEVLA